MTPFYRKYEAEKITKTARDLQRKINTNFAYGTIDSRRWTGLTPRVPLRVHWFRFRMWFCQDCQACGGNGRVMMQTGMSCYDDVECDICHGSGLAFTWPRAVAYRLMWPFFFLGRVQVALWERALQWKHGPCPVCNGSGRERLGVPYVELPVVCSMCHGAGHRLAHDATMEQIKADIDAAAW